MKKFKLGRSIGVYLLVSSLAMANPVGATQSLEKTFETLEKEYENLMKKEENFFKSKENAAIAAQEKLNQQKVLYEEVAQKEQQLNSVKNVRFYKEQYANLAQKYKQVMEGLTTEMNEQKRIIDEFEKIKSIKGGN
ncbi:MAG: adhesion protein FadA [Fusobacteriaceae bacterium]